MAKKATPTKTSAVRKSAATGRYLKTSTAARPPRTTANERNVDSGNDVPTGTAGDKDLFNAQLMSSFADGDRHAEDPDDDTIERLAAEAEQGIPEEKLRRRGRPPIGDGASSTYSVRLPIDLVALTDERSAMDGFSRGETIRRALIEYLTR